VNQVGTTAASLAQFTYTGFPPSQSGTTLSLPLVQGNNAGIVDGGIGVQNVGDGPTTVTVQVSTTQGSFDAASSQVPDGFPLEFDLEAGEVRTLFSAGNTGFTNFVGSATLTSDRENIVATVNQSIGATAGESYEGFVNSNATQRVSMPLLMSNNNGIFTSFQCQNVGNGSTDLTIEYGDNTAGTNNPPTNAGFISGDRTGLAAGASVTVFQANDPDGVFGNGVGSGERYVGSAIVTSSSQPIVCIVNQQSQAETDNLLVYNGINTE
jgi:hypothetical protein